MDRTNCKTVAASMLGRRVALRSRKRKARAIRIRAQVLRPSQARVRTLQISLRKASRRTRTPNDESITAVYFAAGRNHAVDDRHSVGGLRRLSRTADFSAAASRLPHNSGTDILSGRQPGCDDVVRDGATGAPVRADPRFESDDVDELFWQLDRHVAVRA